MQVTTIGLDIAKRVFQVHGIDCEGAIVVRRKLKRSELLHFFNRLTPCSSAPRLVRLPTIGRAN